jgi:hypothetical protein
MLTLAQPSPPPPLLLLLLPSSSPSHVAAIDMLKALGAEYDATYGVYLVAGTAGAEGSRNNTAPNSLRWPPTYFSLPSR